ncbi:MAG: sodium:solute symporter family protein [bacterium]
MLVKAIVIALYAVMIIWMGVLGLRKTKTFNEFFLAGGKVGPWMTAFTYGTAYFSAVLFIGFAGKIGWSFGYSGLWVAAGNVLVGVVGVWYFLGPKVKEITSKLEVQTMAEFFDKRYRSPFLKFFSSVSIFVFLVPYTAAVFMGLSYLFRSNFGVDYSLALGFMGLFTAVYLVMGGYKSMTMIDVIFGIIMCAGVIILFFSTLQAGGGMTNITQQLYAIKPELTEWIGPPGFWPLFCLVFLTSVAPFGMPQLVQKFYAIKDKRAIRIGMTGSTVFAVLVVGVAYFTGSTARIFLSPETSPDAFYQGKPIFDAIMPEFLVRVIPGSLSILILLLVLAASMSTLAALVLVSSSAVAKDLYAGFINPEVSDRNLTLLMRICSAFFIVLSVILAFFKPSSIVTILGISWGAIGSVFLGPFIWGVFWKKATKLGAITSSLGGLAVCLILYTSGHSSPESGTIGMMVSIGVNPVVSVVQHLVYK